VLLSTALKKDRLLRVSVKKKGWSYVVDEGRCSGLFLKRKEGQRYRLLGRESRERVPRLGEVCSTVGEKEVDVKQIKNMGGKKSFFSPKAGDARAKRTHIMRRREETAY